MKKVSIYSSDFEKQEDWKEFLEELEFDHEEKEVIQEVELSIKTAKAPDQGIEEKIY